MNHRSILLSFVVVTALIAGTAAPVAGEGPQSVEQCQNAPLLEPGSYSGTMTPDGVHFFRLNLDTGDYATIRFEFNQGEINRLQMFQPIFADDKESYGSFSTTSGNENFNPPARFEEFSEFADGGQTQVWAEEAPVCVQISSQGNGAGGYTMSLAEGDSDPPEIVTADEAQELRNQLAEARATIDDLQSRDPEINFNLRIEPANGNTSFQAGSTAVVSTDTSSKNAPKTATLQYNSETREVSVPGETKLSLSKPGSHDMVISYGGVQKTTTIRVEESKSAQDGAQGNPPADDGGNEESGTPSEENTDGENAKGGEASDQPGFGIGIAVISLCAALMLHRRNN